MFVLLYLCSCLFESWCGVMFGMWARWEGSSIERQMGKKKKKKKKKKKLFGELERERDCSSVVSLSYRPKAPRQRFHNRKVRLACTTQLSDKRLTSSTRALPSSSAGATCTTTTSLRSADHGAEFHHQTTRNPPPPHEKATQTLRITNDKRNDNKEGIRMVNSTRASRSWSQRG